MSAWRDLSVWVTAALSGVLFGAALCYGGLVSAPAVRSGLRLTSPSAVQHFLTAAGTSTVVFALARRSPVKFARQGAASAISSYLGNSDMGVWGIALGSFLVGVGIAVSGMFPAAIYAHLGSGSTGAVMALVGAVAGAAVYGLLHERIARPLSWGSGIRQMFVHDVIGLSRLSSSFLIAMATFLLAYYVLPLFTASGGSWKPLVSGLVTGCLQLPLTSVVQRVLSSSTTFAVFAGNTVGRVVPTPYLSAHKSGIKVWWQVVFMLGVAVGAQLWSRLSGDSHHPTFSFQESFVGGVILGFGARAACGCSEGHSISGFGSQALTGYLAFASMLLGGQVATRVLLPQLL